MRLQLIMAAAATAAGLTACGGSATPQLDTMAQRGSYAIGVRISRDISSSGAEFSNEALVAGLRDGLAGAGLALSEEDLAQAFQEFTTAARTSAGERMAALAEQNRAQGEEFLAQNGAREEVTVLPSGLQYEVITAGNGPRPTAENRVTVNYRGTLTDGTEFDAGDGATFSLGGVIDGFAEGIQLMPVGSTYRFFIPAELAYGPAGSPPNIGPNAALIFQIELVAIVN